MQNQLGCIDVGYRLPDGTPLIDSLTFSLGSLKTGIIGSNGIGKTTLLEILAGLRLPASGRVIREGRSAYLRQFEAIAPATEASAVLGVAKEISAYGKISRGDASAEDYDLMEQLWNLPELLDKTREELGLSHISLDRQVATLSGGELTRLRFARVLLQEPDFLLLDEPTNHLDLAGREFVYDLVDSWTNGLVIVSHDRTLLGRVDEIAEMSARGLEFYGGGWDFYCEMREVEKAAAEEDAASAKARLKRTRIAAQEAREKQQRRSSAGRKNLAKRGISPMAAGNLKRRSELTTAKLTDRHRKKVEEARRVFQEAKQRLPADNRVVMDLNLPNVPKSKRMVELRSVNYRYPESAADLWPTGLDAIITGQDRIWLKGANGSGKSTLLDIIAGYKRASTGEARIAAVRTAILDQRVGLLRDELSVLENVRAVAPGRPRLELQSILGRFQFRGDAALKKASVLSGGERMRAGLACLLGAGQAPEILMLDEPTNNLDLAGVDALISALKPFTGTLIVVSHDLTFIEEVALDRSIELFKPEQAFQT
jgi:ATPase subunit of ABC transporter with duplicated ATPase domains